YIGEQLIQANVLALLRLLANEAPVSIQRSNTVSKTIIVSNRLPIKITEDDDGYALHPSEGGLATGLASIHAQGENTWVDWPGIILDDAKQQAHCTDVWKGKRLPPLFLHDDEIRGCYEAFSNEVLWPIFHYMPNYAVYELDNWQTYVRVNEKFRDLVLDVAEPEDTIWVHDYQLLLLPGLLRSALPDASIGFFQHIPFPSQELFRLTPWRRQLLAGLLGAELL